MTTWLECPFCKSDDLEVVDTSYEHKGEERTEDFVECQNCAANAPATIWNTRKGKNTELELRDAIEEYKAEKAKESSPSMSLSDIHGYI